MWILFCSLKLPWTRKSSCFPVHISCSYTVQEENIMLFPFGNLKDSSKAELTWFHRKKVSCAGPFYPSGTSEKKRSQQAGLASALFSFFPCWAGAEIYKDLQPACKAVVSEGKQTKKGGDIFRSQWERLPWKCFCCTFLLNWGGKAALKRAA